MTSLDLHVCAITNYLRACRKSGKVLSSQSAVLVSRLPVSRDRLLMETEPNTGMAVVEIPERRMDFLTHKHFQSSFSQHNLIQINHTDSLPLHSKPKFFAAHKITNGLIEQLTIVNPPVQVFSINGCTNTQFAYITIDAKAGDSLGKNTDAFDIGDSDGITISTFDLSNFRKVQY